MKNKCVNSYGSLLGNQKIFLVESCKQAIPCWPCWEVKLEMVMIFLVNREVWKNSYSSGVIYLASDLLLLSKKEPGLETTGEIIT